MAQHIGIQIVDEANQVLNYPDLNLALLQKFISSNLDFEKSPLLFSIDEYGLTYFNQRQCKRLTEELKKINSEIAVMNLVSGMSQYLLKVEQHQLVRLIGD
jgi:hypothetical protein